VDRDEDGKTYADRTFDEKLRVLNAEKSASESLEISDKKVPRFRRPQNVEVEFESVYLYLGDDSGFINVWDLSNLLHTSGIEK
jgi:hypothetical protein